MKVQSKENRNSVVSVDLPAQSDVLISTRTEIFLIPESYELKMRLLYNIILKKHIPLGPEKRITDADEISIRRLLNDDAARDRIDRHREDLNGNLWKYSSRLFVLWLTRNSNRII